MEPLPVDVFQLQRRDPAAWAALLARIPGLETVAVRAVHSEPLSDVPFTPPGRVGDHKSRRARRYVLSLDGCSDPVTFVVKRTTATEAAVYQTCSESFTGILPPCRYAHLDEEHSWIVLEEIPDHYPPHSRLPEQTDCLVTALAQAHGAGLVETVSHPAIRDFLRPQSAAEVYTWDRLRREQAALLDEGPGAVISEHAIRHAGRLAPTFLQAANGLVIMRALGGWPGVLGESHLAAAADLLDDPAPLFAALEGQPQTLIHGSPHPYHWRLTLFDEQYLLDWSEAHTGPAVLDLIAFIELYPLVFRADYVPAAHGASEPVFCPRELSPLLEETLVDGYVLSMATVPNVSFNARAFRAALPAARCLHVLTNWFPTFAAWFDEMPDKYVWQRVNRMSDAELAASRIGPLAGLRPYLAGVFHRFLQAYRSL